MLRHLYRGRVEYWDVWVGATGPLLGRRTIYLDRRLTAYYVVLLLGLPAKRNLLVGRWGKVVVFSERRHDLGMLQNTRLNNSHVLGIVAQHYLYRTRKRLWVSIHLFCTVWSMNVERSDDNVTIENHSMYQAAKFQKIVVARNPAEDHPEEKPTSCMRSARYWAILPVDSGRNSVGIISWRPS